MLKTLLTNMIRITVWAFVLVSCTVMVAHGQQVQPAKHALLVAVNGYANGKPDPIPELDTTRDVKAIREVLTVRWGFRSSEIVTLSKPEETTHAKIIAAFRNLIKATKPGDICYFHYSGHGSEAPDSNDPTGIDQTLVPSDYLSRNDPIHDIRDKQLKSLLKDLQKQRPGSVFLTFDCCHSGTITRGDVQAKVRGFDRQGLRTASGLRGKSLSSNSLIDSDEAILTGYTVISACRDDQQATETKDDNGHYMGLLSYALCYALGSANTQTTYHDIYNRVRSIMAGRVFGQSPQIEGKLDQVVFGTKILHPDVTIGVSVRNGSAYLMAGTLMGLMPGAKVTLYPHGTKTLSGAHPLGTATVSSADMTDATIKPTLEPNIGLGDLRDARAVITERRFANVPLQVNLSDTLPLALRTQLIAILKDLRHQGLIQFTMGDHGGTDAPDLSIRQLKAAFVGKVAIAPDVMQGGLWHVTETEAGNRNPTDARSRTVTVLGGKATGPDSLVLQLANGAFVTVEDNFQAEAKDNSHTYVQALNSSDHLAQDICEALRRLSRNRILEALIRQYGDPEYKIQLRIFPCEVETVIDPDGSEHTRYKRDLPVRSPSGGQLQFPVGTYYCAEVCNRGTEPAFVTILDLTADGKLDSFYPPKPHEDLVTAPIPVPQSAVPGKLKWTRLCCSGSTEPMVWQVTEPLGAENLVVIATRDDTDFTPIVDTTRGATSQSRAAQASPFGRLLNALMNGTRAANPTNLPIDGFGLSQESFAVIPVLR